MDKFGTRISMQRNKYIYTVYTAHWYIAIEFIRSINTVAVQNINILGVEYCGKKNSLLFDRVSTLLSDCLTFLLIIVC